MTKAIGIVLARGGSKRLPRKNVLDFFGKPMLAWTIQASLNSKCFNRVLVSTDDEEIARIALEYGAEAPFLRGDAADDHAPSSLATICALRQAEEYWSESYDVVAQLMANCPLRTAADIREGIVEFYDSGAAAQISCFDLGWSHPWWAAKIDSSGAPDYLFPNARSKRSQDLPKLYSPSGALWIARREPLLEAMTFYANDHRWLPINRISAMDIDDEEDLAFARACYLIRNRMSDNP